MLDAYAEVDVPAHMERLGSKLISGYNKIAAGCGLPTWMVGQPYHPKIEWEEEGPGVARAAAGAYEVARSYPNRHRASLFYQEVVRRGHLLHPNGINVTLAHSEESVDALLGAAAAAFEMLAKAIRAGDVRDRIEGNPIDPAPAWRVVR